MAAATGHTGRNVRFSASLTMLYNVGAGKDCAGKTDRVNWTERLTQEVTCRSPKVAHFRRDLHTLLVFVLLRAIEMVLQDES